MNIKNNALKQLLTQCRKARIGLPAFNYSDVWDLTAIVKAAQRSKVSVIAASIPQVTTTLGIDVCQAMVSAFDRQSAVSIIHHLDHSTDIDQCIRAIDAGYPSVMIDSSKHPLKENIRITREVVRYAHRKGAVVEAEIGRIKGAEAGDGSEDNESLARVDEAVELVRETEVDSLAVGIGTAHGFYTAKPQIRFDRLQEIAAVVDVPLVMHGGTGIPDEDMRKAISLGITKVNVGTIIFFTYLKHLREELTRAGDNAYTLDIMPKVLPYIEEVIIDRIQVIACI